MKKKQKLKFHSKEIACGTADSAWLHAFSGKPECIPPASQLFLRNAT